MPRLALAGMSIAQIEKILTDRRAEAAAIGAKRAKLEAELHALDVRLAKLGGSNGSVARKGVGRTPRAKNARSLPNVIFEVLTKAGKAMPVADIVAATQKAGYRSNSPQFRNIVNQTLITNDRFVASSRGIYQLKK